MIVPSLGFKALRLGAPFLPVFSSALVACPVVAALFTSIGAFIDVLLRATLSKRRQLPAPATVLVLFDRSMRITRASIRFACPLLEGAGLGLNEGATAPNFSGCYQEERQYRDDSGGASAEVWVVYLGQGEQWPQPWQQRAG